MLRMQKQVTTAPQEPEMKQMKRQAPSQIQEQEVKAIHSPEVLQKQLQKLHMIVIHFMMLKR